jgi:3D (Asp-Asp-Asp) domain-containing protein
MKQISLLIAVTTLFAIAAHSQTVSTVNIMGYTKDISPTNGFHISGMQFDNESNTVTTIYGDTLPKGSKIYVWNGSGYDTASYTDVFVPIVGVVTKWTADLELGNAKGYWVEAAGSAESILTGDVPMDNAITNSISTGYQLLSYPYPVDRVVTNLGFSPTSGDKIYVWDGTGYSSSSYTDVFVPIVGLVTKWTDETLQIKAGQGFWYESVTDTTWIANKPF